MRMQPAPTVQIVSPPPKRTKVAKAKAKAPAPPKSLTQPAVVVSQGGAPAIGVPGPPPSIPKVASLQKAAQKKAAQKKAAAQASAQQKAGKPPQKGHPQSQSARQGTPPPILSSLQAGVTIVPAEQTHPLDWHEHGIAEAMDMRKRRPLSSLMMRRR